METVIANLLEPGDKILVGNNGIWGSRICDLAGRYNGNWLSFSVTASPQLVMSSMPLSNYYKKACCQFLLPENTSLHPRYLSTSMLTDACRLQPRWWIFRLRVAEVIH
jgi:alanine-glyoxylate transaminase/serine-glyoxylate transaminase/serine-pyruvate transaminase